MSPRLRRKAKVDDGWAYVGTVNFGDKEMLDSLLRLVRTWLVSVMGFQEGLDRRGLMGRFLNRLPNWREYFDKSEPAGDAVPIAWDGSVWRPGWANGVLVSLRTWVGKKGAGPTYMHAKVITVQVLVHRATGQRFRFINCHFLPSYTRKDLSKEEKAARMREAEEMVDELCRIVKRSKIPCIVTMDMNGTEKEAGWAYAQMRAAGLSGFSNAPTKDKRAIDHVLYSQGHMFNTAPLRYVKTESDHLTVIRPVRPFPRSRRRAARKAAKR